MAIMEDMGLELLENKKKDIEGLDIPRIKGIRSVDLNLSSILARLTYLEGRVANHEERIQDLESP